MTISYVGKGTLYSQFGDVSPATPTWPSLSSEQRVIMLVFTGNDTEGTPSPPGPWSLIGTVSGGGGTWGAGVGPRRLSAYAITATGSESGTFSMPWVSTGGGAVLGVQFLIFSKTLANWEAEAFATGEDASSGGGAATFNVTTGNISLAPGDVVIGAAGGSGDSFFQIPVFAASGITFGTVTEREQNTLGGGNRGAMDLSTADVSSGTANVPFTLTLDAFGDAITGVGMAIRLRESAGGGGASIPAIVHHMKNQGIA